jgi:hypothetical protein
MRPFFVRSSTSTQPTSSESPPRRVDYTELGPRLANSRPAANVRSRSESVVEKNGQSELARIHKRGS